MNNRVPGILWAVVLGTMILTLGGCTPWPASYAELPEHSYEPPFRFGGGTRFDAVTVAQAQTLNPGQGAQPGPVKRLAVSHSFTLQLPNTDVEAVQQRHLSECSKLGCTVVSTTLDRSTGRITARSEVRIAPDAFAAFADILAAPPAKIVTHSESAEDKTAPMLDIEKRLEVKTALRDRLAAMLREPGTKSPADLATIEKELAQVQGDIEAIVAQHDYLRTITETVRVNVSYVGLAAQAAGIDLSPISRAGSGIVATLVQSVANLISFLAAVVPWLPLVALLMWGGRRAFRRWRARSTAA
jgi:hypothetical protein